MMKICNSILQSSSGSISSVQTVDDLSAELDRLEEEIANFQNTLDANPALDAVIRPQLDLRLARKKELLAEVELKKSDVAQKMTPEEIREAELFSKIRSKVWRSWFHLL